MQIRIPGYGSNSSPLLEDRVIRNSILRIDTTKGTLIVHRDLVRLEALRNPRQPVLASNDLGTITILAIVILSSDSLLLGRLAPFVCEPRLLVDGSSAAAGYAVDRVAGDGVTVGGAYECAWVAGAYAYARCLAFHSTNTDSAEEALDGSSANGAVVFDAQDGA